MSDFQAGPDQPLDPPVGEDFDFIREMWRYVATWSANFAIFYLFFCPAPSRKAQFNFSFFFFWFLVFLVCSSSEREFKLNGKVVFTASFVAPDVKLMVQEGLKAKRITWELLVQGCFILRLGHASMPDYLLKQVQYRTITYHI